MMNFLSDDLRRDPYPLYEQVRSSSPLLHEPQSDMWLVFDYERRDCTYLAPSTCQSASSQAGLPLRWPDTGVRYKALP